MKYYLAYVEEFTHEFEFQTTLMLQAESDAQAKQFLDILVKSWYYEDYNYISPEEVHEYFNGEVQVWAGQVYEIPEEVFDVNRKCGISDMTFRAKGD